MLKRNRYKYNLLIIKSLQLQMTKSSTKLKLSILQKIKTFYQGILFFKCYRSEYQK